jgi:hypothetical protein
MKIRPVEADLFHAGIRTDRRDWSNSRFSKRAQKLEDISKLKTIMNAQSNNIKATIDIVYRLPSRYVIRGSLWRIKRNPYTEAMFICYPVSVAKPFVGFSWNSIYQFFINGPAASVSWKSVQWNPSFIDGSKLNFVGVI